MKLDELEERAILLKNENIKLRKDVNAKKSEYAQMISKNFVEIVLPYIRKTNRFIQKLDLKYSKQEKHLIINSEMRFDKTVTDYGIALDYLELKPYGLECRISYEERVDMLDKNHWLKLAQFFESVDACNRFIEQLNLDYTKLIESAIEQYEVDNSALTETLQNLTEQMKNASYVEQKDDGSIKLTFNGKTYIGTIKEA